ncbi:MAG: DUF3305 domain-containing protein [Burkholderiaceae bacterium]
MDADTAADAAAAPRRLTLRASVLMAREAQPNRWEDWRFRLAGVLLDTAADEPSHAPGAPRLLRDDGHEAVFSFGGFEVELHADEAKGYQLNLTSGTPVWFVMWRVDEDDPSRAWPERVTLSYHEAGRLLDAQERVDNWPLPAELVELLQAFTDTHYKPEPKRRQRPASFLSPERRDRDTP